MKTVTDHELSKIADDWAKGMPINTGIRTAFAAGIRYAEQQVKNCPIKHLSKKFVNECNNKLEPMGVQLNSLLTHPQCTKDKCYCGQKVCYYSPLWV